MSYNKYTRQLNLSTLVLLSALMISSLTGCEKPQEVITAPSPSADKVEAPVSAKVEPPKVMAAESEKEKEKETEKAKKKLDLSMPVDNTASSVEAGAALEEEKLLPDMFVKKEKNTSIGGGVIRNAENENYVDSIEGAQVNIEIKTD